MGITSSSADRRDPGAPRRAIRATVDLTPDDEGENWQADAIDLSMTGMAMRGNVLPEVGEQLSLMFMQDGSSSVAARGEVVWALDKGPNAGAFGVRFTDVPAAAEQSLRRMLDLKDDVMVADVKLPPDDARVKLFIHGMDAPLRARVRSTSQGEIVVGSDLSFLKLGDKVDVDGAGTKVTGVIEGVQVEVDAKTRVPRLVLSIDLGGKKKKVELGNAPTMFAETPRVSEPEIAPLKPARVAPAREPAKPRVAQATTVLPADDAPVAVISQHDAEVSYTDEDSAPGWLTQGVRSVRGAMDRVSENAGPGLRRAFDAVGGLKDRIVRRGAEASDAGEDAARKNLRPQHPEASDADGAVVTNPGKRNRKVGLYAAVGVVLAAGIVAYASSSGPAVEAPRPQVAVSSDAGVSADPNAPDLSAVTDPNVPADPNAVGELAAGDPSLQAEPGEGVPEQPEPRWVGGRRRSADLAAAASNADGQGEAPVIQNATQRSARFLPPALQRPAPMGQRQALPMPRAVQPAGLNVAQGPARPVVFGNPAVRTGTVLRLRMNGPVAAIQGVGARGAQIVLTVPGRHSLDMAAPFVSQDPRIAGAGVLNGAAGASLTLRFREAAPPFVARSRGNMLEITLAPTPGSAPMRAGVRPSVVIGARSLR